MGVGDSFLKISYVDMYKISFILADICTATDIGTADFDILTGAFLVVRNEVFGCFVRRLLPLFLWLGCYCFLVLSISRVNAAHFCIRVMGGFAYFVARTCIGSFLCTSADIEAAASALTCTLPRVIRDHCTGIYLSSAVDSK